MTYTVTDLGRDGWSVYNAATRSDIRVRGPHAADIAKRIKAMLNGETSHVKWLEQIDAEVQVDPTKQISD